MPVHGVHKDNNPAFFREAPALKILEAEHAQWLKYPVLQDNANQYPINQQFQP